MFAHSLLTPNHGATLSMHREVRELKGNEIVGIHAEFEPGVFSGHPLLGKPIPLIGCPSFAYFAKLGATELGPLRTVGYMSL